MNDQQAKRSLDCAEYAWTIIANAGGGNWELESKDWQTAAAKWRDESYYPLLSELREFPSQAARVQGGGDAREASNLKRLHRIGQYVRSKNIVVHEYPIEVVSLDEREKKQVGELNALFFELLALAQSDTGRGK